MADTALGIAALFAHSTLEDEMADPAHLARIAYTAYGESTGNENFLGDPMPTWEDLPESIRTAWEAAAGAVASEVTAPSS